MRGQAGRAVVTGGAGFIGSHVVDALVAEGWAVGVVDDLSRGCRENVAPQAELVVAPVQASEARAFMEAFRPHVVFHLAAQVSVAASAADPVADANANVLGTIAVAAAAVRAGARRLVVASSAAVYGTPRSLPIDEDECPLPTSPYGVSKLACEHYARVLAEQAGREWCVLRYANVFGPRQRDDGEAGVVARFAHAIHQGGPLTVFGDGQQTRDFIFVSDVAWATVLAGVASGAAGRVLNVGTGQETSILELARLLWRAAGRDGTVPLEFAPERPGDVRRSALKADRARQLLAWAPAVRLDEGLARTLRWQER